MSSDLRNIFFYQCFFLPNTEVLPLSKVYAKSLEVITVVFTYGIVLLPLKNGCSVHL